MPLQKRVRLEEENNLIKASTRAGGQSREFANEDDTGEFLPSGDAGCVGVLPLQNSELLPQEQDRSILVTVSLTTYSDDDENQRKDGG